MVSFMGGVLRDFGRTLEKAKSLIAILFKGVWGVKVRILGFFKTSEVLFKD